MIQMAMLIAHDFYENEEPDVLPQDSDRTESNATTETEDSDTDW